MMDALLWRCKVLSIDYRPGTHSRRTPMKQPMIVDGHEDLAYNAVFIGLDPSVAAEDKRLPLSPDAPPHRGGIPMAGIPNLLKGNVRVLFATLFANLPGTLHAPQVHT